MNLDRFSRALEMEFSVMVDDSFIEVEEELTCSGCGGQLYVGEENILASEIWEDEFLHDDEGCKAIYYKKNRAAVVGGSGLAG